MRRNPFAQYPYSGIGDTFPAGDCETINAIDFKVRDREDRIRYLVDHGEPYWLPVQLGLGTTPAAGSTFSSVTPAVDFDLLLVGLHSDLRLSLAELRDSARNRLLTNGPTLISAIATFTTSAYTMDRGFFFRHYLLPARAQLAITITADGTESNGRFNFLCLQPPAYSA